MLNPTSVGQAIVNAIAGQSITPPGDANSPLDTTFGPVFTTEPTQPAADGSGFSAEYKATNWMRRIGWGAGQYGPQRVVWRYGAPFSEAHFYGNAVAITRRHVITSDHGNAPYNTKYFWLADGNAGHYRSHAYPVENVTYKLRVGSSVQGQVLGDTGWARGYRLYWMTSDIPAEFICRIPHPWTWPNIAGRPVVLFNQYEEAVIWRCAADTRYPQADPHTGSVHDKFQLNRPADSQQQKLWRAVANGDSGSPVFTTYTNIGGQVTLVYLGHVTNPSSEPPGDNNQYVYGPLCFANSGNHFLLIAAIQAMNRANGFAATAFMPGYVSEAYRPPGSPGF
jgi:hypothetical protein